MNLSGYSRWGFRTSDTCAKRDIAHHAQCHEGKGLAEKDQVSDADLLAGLRAHVLSARKSLCLRERERSLRARVFVCEKRKSWDVHQRERLLTFFQREGRRERERTLIAGKPNQR